MSKPTEVVVTTLDALAECCAHLAQHRVFGFDTEFVGETSYHPELCLIQVATEHALYLIDPFAFESLDIFWNVVVDPAHLVIVHAGREEIRLCQLASGKAPANVFDLQIAGGLAGLSYPMGHGNLVEALLHKRLSKGETLTEWRHRPLTDEQIGYAFDDVRHLLAVYHKLQRRLEELDHVSWAREEFDRLRELSQADEAGLVPTGEKWRKLKGAGTLERRRLAVLRALFQWREELAHKSNRPPRALLRDDLLVEIARRNPRSAHDLHVVRGLAKKHADQLMAVIETARALGDEHWPIAFEREAEQTQAALLTNVLGLVLADWCARQHVASALAASTNDLKLLVKSRLRREPLAPQAALARGWRRQHLLPALEAFLDGKTGLRVRDVESGMPFTIE